jgi:hypothetical protein
MNPFSNGIRAENPGNPEDASVIAAMLLLVAFLPLRRLERVGEHSAVV